MGSVDEVRLELQRECRFFNEEWPVGSDVKFQVDSGGPEYRGKTISLAHVYQDRACVDVLTDHGYRWKLALAGVGVLTPAAGCSGHERDLPRYSFKRDAFGIYQRVADPSGLYVEHRDAWRVIRALQSEVNHLRSDLRAANGYEKEQLEAAVRQEDVWVQKRKPTTR